jgi:hypothetical protein
MSGLLAPLGTMENDEHLSWAFRANAQTPLCYEFAKEARQTKRYSDSWELSIDEGTCEVVIAPAGTDAANGREFEKTGFIYSACVVVESTGY